MTDPMHAPSSRAAGAVAELLPAATRRLVRAVDRLSAEELRGASALPGWSRAHVLAHLALNAEGLTGALSGVATGHRVPMYASQEARERDIVELADRSPAAIRTRLLGAGTALADALAAIPADAWATTFERVPGGPAIPVGAVPGMRLSEVEIHHADLEVGYQRSSWPTGVAAGVLDSYLTRGVADSPFTVHATDLDRRWIFGEGGPVVSGTAADLAWWLSGRGAGAGVTNEGGELPQIGAR